MFKKFKKEVGVSMFNISLKNKLVSFNKGSNICNLKNKFMLSNKKNTNLEELKIKTSNLNLVNPDEILNFIVDKEEIIELIQKTHILINEYFPEADLYLKLHDDPEFDEPVYDLVTHIVNEDKSTWKERFFNLVSDSIELESDYPEYVTTYSIIIGLKP